MGVLLRPHAVLLLMLMLMVRLSTALGRSCGLSSFRFDFSGNGDSEGQFRYGQYRSEAQELGAAKQHLEQQLGYRVVGMLGHSKGGTDVLMYAGCYAEQFGAVPCIVNLAARLDVRQGVVRRLGQRVLSELESNGKVEMSGESRARGAFSWWLTQEDLDDRLSTDVAAAAAQIPPSTAVLTVHGSADADVPVADAREFSKRIQNHKLVVLEGADHTFSSSGAMYELAAAVLPFISSHAQSTAV